MASMGEETAHKRNPLRYIGVSIMTEGAVPSEATAIAKVSPIAVAAREFRESIGLLGTRRYGTFWVASFLSNIGTWAQQVAQPWLLVSLGTSPFLIGLDSFAMNGPVWALTLLGGVLADRADRRRVIALFQSIQMLCPTAIAALLFYGAIQPLMIIGLSFVVGVTDALSMPSFQSITPTIVERDRIGRGLALNATQFNLSRILGPAIAGVLMAGAGTLACFVLSAASYIPFIGVALWILPGSRPATNPSTESTGLFAGLREVAAAPHLRGALFTVFATSMLCGPLVTFSPLLVKDALHGDASHFSGAVAMFGAGGLIGALALLAVPPGKDRRWLSSRLALCYGLVVISVSFLPSYWGLPPLMALAGVAMSVSNTAANSLLQATAPPGLLGQTVSLFMLATRGGLPIGALLTGVSIELLGIRDALLINGALAVIAHATIGYFWLRHPLPAPAGESETDETPPVAEAEPG
jgi:MFS family permease